MHFLSAAHGTSCYQCVSTYGWDDCAAKQTVKSCPVDKDRCGVGILEVYNPESGNNVIFYVKGCTSISECWSFQTSRECNEIRDQYPGTYVSCQGVCCSGNNCNGANSPRGMVYTTPNSSVFDQRINPKHLVINYYDFEL